MTRQSKLIFAFLSGIAVFSTPLAFLSSFTSVYLNFSVVLPTSLLSAILLLFTLLIFQRNRLEELPKISLVTLVPLLFLVNGSYYFFNVETFACLAIVFLSYCLAKEDEALGFGKVLIVFLILFSTCNLLSFFLNGQRSGFIGNINWYSALIAASTPCLFFFYRREKLSLIILSLIVLGFTLLSVFQLSCKASYLALALAPCFCFLHFKKNKKLSIIIVAFGLILGVVIPIFTNHHDIRFNYWYSTVNMILDHPIFGIGAGQFEKVFADYILVDQKLTLIYTHGTAHPHNEFLNIAAQYGLPLAFFWLFIIFKALTASCSNKQEYILRTSLFILFMQGMFDKTLTIPPLDTFFYILVGLSLVQSNLRPFQRAEKVLSPQKGLLLSVLLCSLLLTFFVRQTVAEVYERKALNASVDYDYQKCYQMHTKSISWAPWDMKRHYAALNLSVSVLKNTSLAEPHVNYILDNQPFAGQVQILAALYYEQLALEDRSRLNENLKLAMDSYERAVNFNLIDLKSHNSYLKFTFKYLPYSKAVERFSKIQEVYSIIANLVEERIGKKMSEVIQSTKSTKDLQSTLSILSNLVAGIKKDNSVSVFSPEPLNHIHDKLKGSLNLRDAFFFREMLYLKEQFADKGLQEIIKLNIEGDVDGKFKLPPKVLEDNKGNSLSVACLISQVLALKGIDNIISFKEGQYFFTTYKEGKALKINANGKFEVLNEEDIKVSSFKYFCYPQAFYKKNELLSHLLAHGGHFPVYSKDPGLALKAFNSHPLFKKHRKQVQIITNHYGIIDDL